MNVVFRVDASLKIGVGHVMRCLSLAKVLKENGMDVQFICRKHKGNLIDKIRSSDFYVYELKLLDEIEFDKTLTHSHWLGSTQQQDADECIDILNSKKSNWFIVDHYALDERWQKKLKPYYEKLMVIDDLADRKHHCDILLDQTFGREQDDYLPLTPKDCDLLLGSSYALLRTEFAIWRGYSLERRRNPKFKQLLINMGGVDNDNVTESILDELRQCQLPKDIYIIVLMGRFAPHIESVKAKAISLPYKTDVKVDIVNIAENMANSDIAIGAAGATTWERCCLGLPTIQIVIADNQNTINKSLARINAIKLLQDIKELGRIMRDVNDWMSDISDIASHISDGLGSLRVLSVIKEKNL